MKSATVELRTPDQLTLARRVVMEWATKLAYGIVDKTKFVTAASELGRNTIVHGRGGTMEIHELMQEGRSGLKLIFADTGPGIPNIELAMKDGYTTANSMGLGLGGTRRLVNEFELVSTPGAGTTVTIIQWKRR